MADGKKSKFGFGFMQDAEDDDDGGLPDNIDINMPKHAPATTKGTSSNNLALTTSTNKKSALKPAELPNTESFQTNNSSVIGSVDQSAPIMTKTASQRINDLNRIELPVVNGSAEDEIYGGDGVEIDYDL